MKFTSFILAITLATKATSFVPQAATPLIRSLANKPNEQLVTEAYAIPTSSTSLNLFGFGASKLASPAEAKGKPTEAEIRALFELWNSALATGDSRIVASRYTEVSNIFSCVSFLTISFDLTPFFFVSCHVLIHTVASTPCNRVRCTPNELRFRQGLLRRLPEDEAPRYVC